MTFKRVFKYFLPVIIFGLTICLTNSCRTDNISQTEKKIQKEKKKREKDDMVLYEKALKRHMKGQTKETQKQMKENYEKAQKFNDRKKDGFIKRFIDKQVNKSFKKQKG